MNSELLQGFYLGDLLVEPLKGQVTGKTGSEHIPPKAMEVLLCLANDPGKLVTREHLITEVWGEGHGSDEALSHAVSEIRHALDDHADEPTFIQTLPRRGYRLVIATELATDHSQTIILGTSNGATVADVGFLENLKRRGVLETAIAYLIVGWLLIQIADIVFAQLLLPQWAGTFVTVLVIAGFPIAILLSWFLEFRDGKAVVDLSPLDERRRRFSRTYLSVISALGMAAVLVFLFDQVVGLPDSTGDELTEAEIVVADNTIAVLPFLNNDGSDETQVFSNGLVDDVITRLSRVPGLLVSSRGDSFMLDPNSASDEVRRRLRVAMYIEGSVEIAGDRMRVIVQLIDSSDGFHILSRSFDRPRDDFFDIRDEITQLTVANVRVALPEDTHAVSGAVAEQPVLDAYVFYRRGIDAMRASHSIDNIERAIGSFDAALEIDPGYAAAYAGKCRAFVFGYGEVDDSSYIENAEAACGMAQRLNPNLVIVRTAFGDLFSRTGRYDEAIAAYNDALEIQSGNNSALFGLGHVYTVRNNFEKAHEALQRAIDLHPGSAIARNQLGTLFYRYGQFAEAAEQYRRVVDLDRRDANGYSNYGTSLMMLGEFEEALPAFEKAIELSPRKATYSNLGLMHYYLGNYDAAIAAANQAVELGPNDHLARSNLGDILTVAGHAEDATAEFQRAAELAEAAFEINPNDPYTMMDLAWIYAMLGQADDARELIDRCVEAVPEEPYAHYYDALIYVVGGGNDEALDALQRATELGYSKVLLAAEPQFAPLRDMQQFKTLTR